MVPLTIDQNDLANIFSISMERALTLPRLSVCHTLREIVTSTTLLALQTLYCFGLAESSELMQQRGHLTAHADTILLSSFYPHTTVEGVGQKTLPRIHLAASLCSLLLLALSMKNGNEGTVLTVCPLDVVAFSSTYGHLDGKREGGMIALLDSVYAHVCLVLLAVYMQVLWTVRVALIPSLAALASAAAFAGSTTTQDIVLTSVLIAFVLNLDEFLYRTLVPLSLQTAFEHGKPRPTSPLLFAKAKQVATVWVWILFALDLAYPTVLYLAFAFGYTLPGPASMTSTAFLRDMFLLRLGLTALCTGHMKFITHASKPDDSSDDGVISRGAIGMWLRVVAIVAGICACGIFTLAGLQLFALDTAFGSDDAGSGIEDTGSGGVETIMVQGWTARMQLILGASWQWQ